MRVALVALTLACAGAVAIGSLGPWVSWERHSRTAPQSWTEAGITSSGVFTLVFAVIAIIGLAAALFGHDQGFAAWGAIVMLALSALTGFYEWLLIADRIEGPNEEWHVGWGMIMVAWAGLVGTVAAIFAARTINEY